MNTGKTVAVGPFSTLSGPARLLLLVINCWTLAQAVLLGMTLALPWAAFRWRLAAGLALLYLIPPLAARLVRRLAPLREGHLPIGQRDFFNWWALFNLQVIFCRLPALEELLRMVPGLYSLWLRLWGARIGRRVYWGAGLRILDRSFVAIGDGVMFGADVRLNPHVLARNHADEPELILATIRIGGHAMIGGYSLLTAGTEIAAGEATRAFLISPPFGKWKNGSRESNSDAAP